QPVLMPRIVLTILLFIETAPVGRKGAFELTSLIRKRNQTNQLQTKLLTSGPGRAEVQILSPRPFLFSNLQSSQSPKMRTPGNAPGGQFHFHAALLSATQWRHLHELTVKCLRTSTGLTQKNLHSFGRRFRTDHPWVYKGSKLA